MKFSSNVFVKLDIETSTNNAMSAILINEDTLFIAHGSSLNGSICQINDNSITVQSVLQLIPDNVLDNAICATLVDENKILIAYRKDIVFVHSIVVDYLTPFAKKIANKKERIGGVAKTSATDGGTVQVLVPKIEEVVNNDL